MDIDFPLILVILVFGSGLIWALDAVFLAPGRRRALAALQERYPNWQEQGSKHEQQYQSQVAEAASQPLVVEYARSFFPVLAVVFVLRSFLVEPFQIPSSSMVPTLQVGDYILVNKYTYGIRLPVLRTKVMSLNEPRRGDVMVFFPPHMNDTYFIKRVVGLPGDTVTYRGKVLYVNGERVERQPIVDRMRPGRDFSVVVQPGHYFMMGDNRDNSSDSRIWGQVPEQDIVGKAFAIWMHWDSFFSLPSFGRVGLIE